jgi:hypothetical protein
LTSMPASLVHGPFRSSTQRHIGGMHPVAVCRLVPDMGVYCQQTSSHTIGQGTSLYRVGVSLVSLPSLASPRQHEKGNEVFRTSGSTVTETESDPHGDMRVSLNFDHSARQDAMSTGEWLGLPKDASGTKPSYQGWHSHLPRQPWKSLCLVVGLVMASYLVVACSFRACLALIVWAPFYACRLWMRRLSGLCSMDSEVESDSVVKPFAVEYTQPKDALCSGLAHYTSRGDVSVAGGNVCAGHSSVSLDTIQV